MIVTCLAVLAHLKSLAIGFAFPQTHPDQESRPPPPPTCTVLHALTCFKFTGVSEYLEDLVARIDVPLLDSIRVGLFDRPTFDFPQLTRLMRRATRFWAPYEVHVDFDFFGIQVTSLPPRPGFDEELRLKFLWGTLEWELSPLVHVFASFLPSIHMVDHLYIDWARPSISPGPISIAQGYMEWLEIFRPFTAVKNLYISKELAHCIARFLKGLVKERVTDVLPALESLFGSALSIGTNPRGHRVVRRRTTALRSPCSCISLELQRDTGASIWLASTYSNPPIVDVIWSFHLFSFTPII